MPFTAVPDGAKKLTVSALAVLPVRERRKVAVSPPSVARSSSAVIDTCGSSVATKLMPVTAVLPTVTFPRPALASTTVMPAALAVKT